MKWPWRREAGLVEPERASAPGLKWSWRPPKRYSRRSSTLQPGVVEEMIQRRPRGEELDRRERTLGLPHFDWVSSNGPKF